MNLSFNAVFFSFLFSPQYLHVMKCQIPKKVALAYLSLYKHVFMSLSGPDKFTFQLLLYCITSLSLLVQLAAQSVYQKKIKK